MKRPSALDLALVAVLALWALLEAILLNGEGSVAQRVAWALAFTLPLLQRRSAPVTVCLIVGAVIAARVLLADGDTQEEGAMPLPVILVAAFSAAVHARTRALAILGGVAVGAAMATAVFTTYYEGTAEPSDGAILGFFLAAAWSAGYFVRRRGERGELAAQQAVLEERARIARELHDIIGHSVSVISLQAGAAEQLVRKDPDKAETHLKAVRETAHEALVEMRRLMGVLKEDEAKYAPQPGLGMLDQLLAQSGMDVDVRREGDPHPLAPGVDTAAYRIVQEALTNARKHGAGQSASLLLRWEPEAVQLEVVNERRETAGQNGVGHGLVGMRERVRLFGGTVDAGPDGDVFRVRARLPL
ncbi:MAG TPA: histidine kinase [Solirubrobacteraceae bacterium]|jgi:signal transduction histidine kinase